MIDTVRTLAQPYSHYLMAHRDLVIVLMGLVVMWTVGHDLLTRWRNQRLTQDMAGRGDPRSVVRRTYATTATAEKAAEPEAAGALPPVRGGRTYARNLGNALQKAGMGPAPIYTPPAPVGWGSGPSPAPGRGAPPPTYAPPSPPWATPAPVPMQPGPPRPAPAPGGATPWPTYAPPGGPVPGQPQQPSHPFFQPPFQLPFQQAAPAAPPAMPPVAAPAPAPQVPLSEPVPPPLPSYIPAPAPVAAAAAPPAAPVEPPAAKAKPKRKRFSLAVLQNLEKTLHRTAGLGESAPVAEASQAWTPPPVPAPTPAVSAMAAPPPVAEPVETPAVEDEAPVSAPEDEQAAPTSEAEEATVVPPEEEAPASPAADYSRVWEQPQPAVSDSRAAMRAMLFGEDEKVPAAADENWASSPAPSTEPEEAVFRFEPVVAEPEPAPSSDEFAAVEETSPQPAAVDEVESPAESATEPLADPWRTEPLAETTEPAAPATDEAEPQVEEPLFSPAATEPAGVDAGSWSPPPPEGSEMQAGGDRGNLVIIEDDQAVAEYYATLFRGNGYSVYVATDGISGVDLCAKVKPAVILLDVMMPRQNGMLVLQTLRASDETKETPVVVLSNFSEPTLVKRALQLGALEYVIKTQVEGAALLEALPRWMNREKAFAAA
jgi:CheY-like chemotaxis protein